MTVARSIYMLWLREIKREWREKSRIIASVITPLLWLLIFGTGMRFGKIPGIDDYQQFIFPGIVGMTLLFSSMRSGISVIWDKEFGFMKEILVAPVSRNTIVLGKAMGGATNALLQGFIVMLFAPIIGLWLNPLLILAAIPIMFVIALGLECIGLLIGIFLDSLEGFQLIMSFINMPMFFLSGGIFPLLMIPATLQIASFIDPLTYGVDAMRAVFLGSNTVLPFAVDMAVVCVFAVVMILICSLALGRKR